LAFGFLRAGDLCPVIIFVPSLPSKWHSAVCLPWDFFFSYHRQGWRWIENVLWLLMDGNLSRSSRTAQATEWDSLLLETINDICLGLRV
jgi:hypothetical protein